MADPSSFRIPYALSENDVLTAPSDALRESGYRCPECEDTVVLKAGEIVRPHFAHRPSSHCTGESALHKVAKLLVRDAVLRALAGGPPISLNLVCQSCSSEFSVGFPTDRVERVEVEWRMRTGAVADLMLLGHGEERLAVEIMATHKVDAVKAGALECAWVELEAEDVVAAPAVWRPRQHALKTKRCGQCRIEEREREAVREKYIDLVKTRWGLTVPNGYEADLARCWKCQEVLLLYRWDGGGDWGKTPPPTPRPSTVKWSYSNVVKHSYWATTCPRPGCGRLQGDFHRPRVLAEFASEIEAEVQARLRDRARAG